MDNECWATMAMNERRRMGLDGVVGTSRLLCLSSTLIGSDNYSYRYWSIP